MSSLLRKRFDSSKCKALLQLSSQRLKILRNKQALAVKKARADVAKLLEKGQDSNSKMQVETVVREEKILTLHDLLDQFCQRILYGLESIKSQKECPLDLREAVASLIFAAPQCADLKELKKVSKQLTLKYGTEFSVAAKELRPECGVNRQVVQSLSSHPLEFDAKLKLLKEIAVENNIKWDYEMATADVSKSAPDLIGGPNHFASASELSQGGRYAIADEQKSMSMHVNEFKGQGSAALQNAISSHAKSASISFGLPRHDVHQFARIITGIGARGTSRAQMAPDGVKRTAVSDPYALARAEGKMDYKVVSDYIGQARSMKLKQESGGDIAYPKLATQFPDREQDHNGLLDASHREDAPQSSIGKKARKRHVHKRNEEDELSDLKNAAEYALASATHAAEAARAAVDLVHMESLERSKGREAVFTNNKRHEMQSEPSSGSFQYENHQLAGMDYDWYAHRERIPGKEGEIEASQNNGRIGDEVPESILDASEDSFKYVVFEQTSGSQTGTHISAQAREYNTNAELNAFPEILHSCKNSDSIIFDSYPEDSGLKEVLTDALSDNIYSNNIEEQELDKKASFRNNRGKDHCNTEVYQDKHAQIDLSVPQFDNLSVPQFDNFGSEDDDYMQKNSSVSEFEHQNGDDANEEEEPFYLRGRAAVATEQNATRASRSKAAILLSTVSFSNDDKEEEDSSTNLQSSTQEASLHPNADVEPVRGSNYEQRPLIMGNNSHQYDLDEASQESNSDEPVRLPIQSLKTPRGLMNTESMSDNSIMGSIAFNHRAGKPTTPRKWKLPLSIAEDWDLDPNYELASPLASVKLSSPNGSSEPSPRVNRKLTWFSGASEDWESMSERSFESHKLDWNPGSSADLNSDSPKPSLSSDNATKMNDLQITQPAPRKPHYGVSKRSVRSTRSRQNQDVPSPSSGNEDVRGPV